MGRGLSDESPRNAGVCVSLVVGYSQGLNSEISKLENNVTVREGLPFFSHSVSMCNRLG